MFSDSHGKPCETRRRGAWALVASACALAACAEPKRRALRDEPSSEARTAESPSASTSSAVAPPGSALASGPRPPVVSLSSDRVDVEGTPAGDLKKIVDGGSMRKVDELYNDLKHRREDWKVQRPESPFPGVAGVRAAPDTSAIALKSVMQTMAYAGYPHLALQIVGAPDVYDVEMQVPPPPVDPNVEPPPAKAFPHVTVETKDGPVRVVFKVTNMILSTTEMPAEELGPACEKWKPTENADGATRVVLHFEDGLTASALVPALRSLRGCKDMPIDMSIR